MTRSNQPPIQRNPITKDSTAQCSPLRARVRQRMLKMAPMALVAAAPLTNAGCDAVPTAPSECQGLSDAKCDRCGRSPGTGDSWAEGSVALDSDNGEDIVLLDIVSAAQVRLPDSYTIVGGTLLPSTAERPGQMRIKPDADATRIRLVGALTCDSKTMPFTITVYLVTPDDSTRRAPYVEIHPL